MNFIRNRNFRAGPQTSLEGFICHQNSDKQQKIKVFGRSGGQFGLAFYGMFTLELYRVSSSFERLLEDTVTPDYHWIFVLLYFILSVILAWICHKVFKFINAFLYKKLKVIFKV